MKTLLIALFISGVLAGCTNEQKQAGSMPTDGSTLSAPTVANADNAAAFKFDKESYDFGQITEGEKVNYEFTFTNIGTSPLIITDATATCGCTVPSYPKEPVAPNGKGTISVTFDSKGKGGMQNKMVTLTANTNPQTTQLRLIGDVKAAPGN